MIWLQFTTIASLLKHTKLFYTFGNQRLTSISMKKTFILILCTALFQWLYSQTTLTIYDNLIFYDGYSSVHFSDPPAGVVKFSNSLFTKKLSAAELSQIGSNLTLQVEINARCDNYDRIGNVNLALVPTGSTTYNPATTTRIEIGRFITPFMNKNLTPTMCPYSFDVSNITKILKDTNISATYDFWIEFEVFGVPYAANTQVAGCSGRNDVFGGTLKLVTNSDGFTTNSTFFHPIAFKNNFNNYQTGATDIIGQTVRTINFSTTETLNNAYLHLITSNHGANSGGEEYNRRAHYVYFDFSEVLNFTPGEPTCEPYRVYNTQGNGIYGPNPRTNAQWQSFSNWCPGAKIPIRTISLGSILAGMHYFKISVPTAVFVEQQGNIPLSVYFQGEKTTMGLQELDYILYDIGPNPTKGRFWVRASDVIKNYRLVDSNGKTIKSVTVDSDYFNDDITELPKGVYFLQMEINGESYSEKIIKN